MLESDQLLVTFLYLYDDVTHYLLDHVNLFHYQTYICSHPIEAAAHVSLFYVSNI